VILKGIQRDSLKARWMEFEMDIEKDFPTEFWMLLVSSKIWIERNVSDEVLPNHISNKPYCFLPCPLLVLSSES